MGQVFEINKDGSPSTARKSIKKKDDGCLANLTPFVLLIGLGAHSVFEGIAMGAEK